MANARIGWIEGSSDPFVSDPEILGGRIVFAGTRVPIDVVFDNLADGLTLDEVVATYPTLDRAAVAAALQRIPAMLAARNAA